MLAGNGQPLEDVIAKKSRNEKANNLRWHDLNGLVMPCRYAEDNGKYVNYILNELVGEIEIWNGKQIAEEAGLAVQRGVYHSTEDIKPTPAGMTADQKLPAMFASAWMRYLYG